MDWDLAKLLFQIFEFILLGIIGIYAYLTRQNKSDHDALQGVKDRVRDLEKEIEFLPSGDEFDTLKTEILTVKGHLDVTNANMTALSSQMATIKTSLDRLNEYLMTRGI